MPALDYINKDGTKYEIVPEIAPLFNTSTAYAKGDCVIKDAVLYRFKTAHSAGAWNSSEVDAINLSEEVTNLKQEYNQLSETKANKNSDNPEMGAGYASQLVSSLRKSDSVPYNFRKVPYDSTLEDGKIVGASVAWNQLLDTINSGTSLNGVTVSVNNGVITVYGTATEGTNINLDKSLIKFPANHVIVCFGAPGGSGSTYRNIITGYNQYFDGNLVFKPSSAKNEHLRIYVNEGYTINVTYVPLISDLTACFGTTIADYVYSLETATAGSGVAWLKEHFPKQFNSGYQAYNAGEIKSISGLVGHKSVGFNQWDETWETGFISTATGANQNANDAIRSKDYIRIVGGASYHISTPYTVYNQRPYFHWYDAEKNHLGYAYAESGQNELTATAPANAWYTRFAVANLSTPVTYNHDICINISKTTGTPKNGDYVAYESHSYALDSTKTLRGILKLDSNNQLYADGDRYLSDGTVERRYGVVDLGTLTWVQANAANSKKEYYANLTGIKRASSSIIAANLVCSNYQTISSQDAYLNTTGIAAHDDADRVIIYDESYVSSTAEAFKTAMSGVYLVYELATPTTETASPYGNPQVINPDGTESYVYTDGAFELPVGHESEYPVNVSGQLDDILDTPTTNGTYTLQATVTDGAVSYEWVSAT